MYPISAAGGRGLAPIAYAQKGVHGQEACHASIPQRDWHDQCASLARTFTFSLPSLYKDKPFIFG